MKKKKKKHSSIQGSAMAADSVQAASCGCCSAVFLACSLSRNLWLSTVFFVLFFENRPPRRTEQKRTEQRYTLFFLSSLFFMLFTYMSPLLMPSFTHFTSLHFTSLEVSNGPASLALAWLPESLHHRKHKHVCLRLGLESDLSSNE